MRQGQLRTTWRNAAFAAGRRSVAVLLAVLFVSVCLPDEKSAAKVVAATGATPRSEEHTSDQSLMRTSYAVFCLKKKKHNLTSIILRGTSIYLQPTYAPYTTTPV